jgi:hypothetical protein
MPNDAELGKQLRTYADGITAFAALQSVAFGIALGGKDFRDSVLKLQPYQIGSMCAVAFVLYICLLAGCHRGEDEVSGASNGKSIAEKKWTSRIRGGRYAVVAVAQGLTFLAIYFTFHGAAVAHAAAAHNAGL